MSDNIKRFTLERTLLNRCPFCGMGEHEYPGLHIQMPEEDLNAYFILCLGCGSEGPLESTKEGAIELWNFRADGRSYLKEEVLQ